MIRTILLAMGDDETSDVASDVCIELAHQFQASVTSLATIDTRATAAVGSAGFGAAYYSYDVVTKLEEELRRTAKERIGEFQGRARQQQVETSGVISEGAPWDCVSMQTFHHDLVVAGSGLHLRQGMTGDAATPGKSLRKIMSVAVCPLLCVAHSPLGQERVLIALDGRASSTRALQQLLHLGLLPEAMLTIVAVDEGAASPRPDLDAVRRYLEAHERLVEIEEPRGKAREVIPRLAQEKKADLVVLGAHGKPRVAEWVLGSTTCDMLAARGPALFIGH